MSINDLKKYNEAYRNGNPLISDREYDDLWDKEYELNPSDPFFNSIGIESRDKVELPFILGSLRKLKPIQENETTSPILKWIKDKNDKFVVTPKLDGNSILVKFLQGKVSVAYLRGDGEYGRDITSIARKFISPIKSKKSIWSRGEVMLNFLPLEFKNKRNAVAGILNKEDSPYHKDLKVIFYENINSNLKCEDEKLNELKKYGLPTIDFVYCNSFNTETDIINILKDFKEKYIEMGFDIDGIVLTKNLSERENVLLPKNKVAFKVNQDAVLTKIIKIENNTSRTGRVIPLIYINPIDIDGSTISKVTGHNYDYIINTGICVGTEISIIKSGDVIPYIVDVFDGGTPELPISCTSCGGTLVKEGVDLVCKNDNCPAQGLKTLEFFIKSIGMMGISLPTIKKLNISSIEELYSLKYDDIICLDGFGKKKTENILNIIKNSLNDVEKYKVLASFGISGLGKSISKSILEIYTIDEIWNITDFTSIEGIAKISSDKIVEGLKEHKKDYDYLLSIGMKFKKEEQKIESNFNGYTLTLTGKAPMKRDDLIKLLEQHNCTVKNISKNVDFLVTDDIESDSSKAKKARNYGVPFMSYDELLIKLGL